MDTLRIGSGEPLQLLTQPGDKLLDLTPGEVVRAQVVDTLAGGDTVLRLKGTLLHVKSEVPLEPDTMVLFRVMAVKGEKDAPDIRLKMVETLPPPRQAAVSGGGFEAVHQLVRDLATLLGVKAERPEAFLSTIEQLLKSLPEDSAKLPKELRDQILTLLQTSLRTTEQNIQNRLTQALSDPWLLESPEWQEWIGASEEFLAGAERLPDLPIKSLLSNTGTALEAKLRALAQSLSEDAAPSADQAGAASESVRPDSAGPFGSDLKARILQLRERIIDSLTEEQASGSQTRESSASTKEKGPLRALDTLNGLLQDIETYQLLSKVTDSFYTFLPLVWKELREAEVAFKRSRGGAEGRSYYCLIHLDFETLGKLTILALKQDQEFFISFETEHDDFLAVLKEHVGDLEKMFQEKGLCLKATDFLGTRSGKLLAPFERLESFENILSVKI